MRGMLRVEASSRLEIGNHKRSLMTIMVQIVEDSNVVVMVVVIVDRIATSEMNVKRLKGTELKGRDLIEIVEVIEVIVVNA